MIFDALSKAACRVSLRGAGAELGGGGQTPRPSAMTAEHRPGSGLWNIVLVFTFHNYIRMSDEYDYLAS